MPPRVTDQPQRSLLSTMILYLLFPALVLGNVGLQVANITEEELGKSERNQTFSVSTNDNSTKRSSNVTLTLYEDEKTEIEAELQSNQTSGVITEDDETFQDQESEFLGFPCYQELLVAFSHSHCGEIFHKEMLAISTDDWCVLQNVIRPYSDMTTCLERLAHYTKCYFPNPDIQDFFLYIHSIYFQNCTKDELLLEDAPHGLVIALTLISVSFIPILVYLVVWKSKVTS